MDTQPGQSQPNLGASSGELEALRVEFARLRFYMDELRTTVFGGPGVVGMRERQSGIELEMKHNDRLLAERINDLIWPKMLAISFTIVGLVFAACGVEFFLIKLHELHTLGFW